MTFDEQGFENRLKIFADKIIHRVNAMRESNKEVRDFIIDCGDTANALKQLYASCEKKELLAVREQIIHMRSLASRLNNISLFNADKEDIIKTISRIAFQLKKISFSKNQESAIKAETKVFFSDSNGNDVCGMLSADNNSKPIVIMVHGLGSGKNSRSYTALKEILDVHRIPSFRFDIFGHGESAGRFEELTVSKAVDDIICAVSFLMKIGYSRFGLVGCSFGGAASIIAAPKIKGLLFVALKAPVSDYLEKLVAKEGGERISKWKERGQISYGGKNLNYSFFEDAERINEYESAENINVPTLVVHGTDDESVPLEQSRKLASTIPNCKLEIIEGGDHIFTNPSHFDRMTKLLSEFILKHLQ